MSTFWQDRSVFITGCTGLIGSWLTASLIDRGARVVGLIRDAVPRSTFTEWDLGRQITCVRGDLSDLTLLERILHEYHIDTVFHLAAQAAVPIAAKDPYLTFESNVRGTYTVLEAARRAGSPKRIVVASSDKAYGSQPVLPYTEAMNLHGDYPYDVSKSCVDLLAQSYWKTYQLPVCITRCANMFGAGDLQWTRIVPRTIRCALANVAPTIRSDGNLKRDYCYVANIRDAYLVLAEKMDDVGCYGEAFNFGSETPLTVLELVTIILKIMGKSELVTQVTNTAVGEIQSQYLDATKAHTRLGWWPRYPLEEGLVDTIEWYAHYLESAWHSPSLVS